MRRTTAAVALLTLSGVLHGALTHRWEGWSAPAVRAAADRIDRIPLQVGDWSGRLAEPDFRTLPEDVIGHGVNVEYTNRLDGSVVSVYLACGPIDGVVVHSPRVCYPANGYECPVPDLRVVPPADGDGPAGEFWVSNYTLPNPAVPHHVRVFWAWSDGTGWQAPDNPRRTFGRSPLLYKCYAVRTVVVPEEPVKGDPALRLLGALIPPLNAVLAAEH